MRVQRIAGWLVIAALSSSCATYRGSAKTAKVGGSLMLVGAGILIVGLAVKVGGGCTGEDGCLGLALLGALPFAVGEVVGLAGLIGMGVHDSVTPEQKAARAEQEREARDLVLRAHTRGRAREVVFRAAGAARADDCVTVRRLDGEVRAIDAEFHASVFLRDVAIKRCLDTPAEVTQP